VAVSPAKADQELSIASDGEQLLAHQVDPVEERRLVRKLDSLIAPLVMIF
jgi:hypothetical protein